MWRTTDEVVRDEQERERQPILQLGEQVEHLGLDRHVERGDGLVEHDEVGLERERPRDPDALALAAGELVRVAGRVLGPQARPSRAARERAPAASDRRPWITSGSLSMSTTRMRGLSDAYGSWNTICSRRRSAAELAAGRASGSPRPSKRIVARRRVEQAQHEPAGRRLAAPRLPDQPERLASVEREGSRRRPRARRPARARRSSRCWTGKCLTRCSTSSTDPAASARHVGTARSPRRPSTTRPPARDLVGPEARGPVIGVAGDGRELRVAPRGTGRATYGQRGCERAAAAAGAARLGGVPGIVRSGSRRSASRRGSEREQPAGVRVARTGRRSRRASPPRRSGRRTSRRRGRPCRRRSRGRG